MMFLLKDSWSTVRLQPMVMVVCFLLHFVSNLGVYDMTTMESPKRQPGKPRIPAALAFSGYRSVCGGPCCPENSSGAGGENEISRPLTGSSWYSRNHKMTVDSLNLLFSDLLVGREFSSKLEVEDVWFFKGWHPRWTVIHKSRIQMPRMGFADLSGAGKYWRLLVETANSLFSLSHHTHIQDSKVLEDEMKRTGWHL